MDASTCVLHHESIQLIDLARARGCRLAVRLAALDRLRGALLHPLDSDEPLLADALAAALVAALAPPWGHALQTPGLQLLLAVFESSAGYMVEVAAVDDAGAWWPVRTSRADLSWSELVDELSRQIERNRDE